MLEGSIYRAFSNPRGTPRTVPTPELPNAQGRALEKPKEQANSAMEACWLATEPVLWIVDSGCSRHMTQSKDAFIEYTLLDTPVEVGTASGARI